MDHSRRAARGLLAYPLRTLSYDAAIPVGGQVSIGFQATHTGNSAAPANFSLNGSLCTIG